MNLRDEAKDLDARNFFDERAKVYDQVSRWAGDEELNSASDEMLRGLHGVIAADIGAGTGIMLSRVKEFQRKVALDISSAMLDQVRDPSIAKVVGDVHDLPFRDSFADLVLCRQLLHYCDVGLAMRNLRCILKEDGLLHVVQVIEVAGVPEEWDQDWARIRNVVHRQHLRRKILETAFRENSLETVKQRDLILRDSYSWQDFFLKNRVEQAREAEVRSFFQATSSEIVKAIDLRISEWGIAYNRLFGMWLLQSAKLPT